jgi:hypothetical protein
MTDFPKYPCLKCAAKFPLNGKWRKCPNCGEPVPTEVLTQVEIENANFLRELLKPSSKETPIEENIQQAPSSFEPTISERKELVSNAGGSRAVEEAVNRTTHAVRSLAIFLFISISTLIPGLFAVLTGAFEKDDCMYSCGFADGMLYFGYGIIGVGFLVGLFAGMIELSKSKNIRKRTL